MQRLGTVPVREYTPADADQMRRDAAALRARIFAPRPKLVEHEPAPALPLPVPPPEPDHSSEDEDRVREAWGRFVRATLETFPQAQILSYEQRLNASLERTPDLMELVFRVTGVERAALVGKRRTYDNARARHIACWLLVNRAGKALPQAGRLLGGLDHTSVLHGCRRVVRAAGLLGVDLTAPSVQVVEALWAVPRWPSTPDIRKAQS